MYHTCEEETGEGAELVLPRTRASARTLPQRVWLTLTPWERNTMLSKLSVCIPRHPMRQGVSMESIWALPAYVAVQKAEESSGLGCMCVPLCLCVPVREGTWRKQGWWAVCMQAPWDSQRQGCLRRLLRARCFSGSRE